MFAELGADGLRAIIDDFVDRIFDDYMIGFHFRQASRERIKEMEYLFAARHLGSTVEYTGKPLREAHAPHPIMGGQFMRRQKILLDTLRDHGASDPIIEHWLAHNEQLRPLITGDSGGDCDPAEARRRVEAYLKK